MTNFTDTQRNVHLAEHHILGLNKLHDHKGLHGARLGKMSDSNATDLKRNMTITRLAQLCVTRFFIRKMSPFSECEDLSYREEAGPAWKACSRDTMCGTIGECFLVATEQVKHGLRSDLKCSVIAVVHLNADLWTRKVSHQKFLGVCVSLVTEFFFFTKESFQIK